MKSWHNVNLCSAFTINLNMNTEIFTNPGSHDFHSTWRWLHLRFVCLSKQFWYHIWFESYLVQFGDKLKNLSPGWVRNSYYESMMIRNHCSSSWHMICRIYLIHDNPRFSTLQKHRRWSLCPTFQRQRSSFCCRRQFSTKIFLLISQCRTAKYLNLFTHFCYPCLSG